MSLGDPLLPRKSTSAADRLSQSTEKCPLEVRVVETVQQMDCARPRRADADAEAPRVFGKPESHEGLSFLVLDADIPDPVLPFPQRFDD